MNKAELINAVADKTNLTKKDAESAVNAVIVNLPPAAVAVFDQSAFT